MKKDVLLVLSIFEGQGWRPIEGYKTVIEARLGKHTLSTGVIPLTASPKFNTELSWEAEKQAIRSYKLNRVPIKVECFITADEKGPRKSLGYVILPLTSAVEGIQVDPKWYKLLGGPNTPHQAPPSILLHLSLETMTLDQQNKMNGKPMQPIKNGQHPFEDRKSYVMGKKSKLEMNYAQQKGPTVNQRIDNQNREIHPLLEACNQSSFGIPSNGVYVEDGAVMNVDEIDSDNLEEEEELEDEEELEGEEGMLEYDSEEEYSDVEENNQTLMIVDAFSMADAEGQAEEDEEKQPFNKIKLRGPPQNLVNVDEDKQDKYQQKVNIDNLHKKPVVVKVSGSSENEKGEKFLKQITENESLLKARTFTREHLQNSLRRVNKQNSLHTHSLPENSIGLEKRLLDTSQTINDCFEKKLKSRKIDKEGESSSMYQSMDYSSYSNSKNISKRNYDKSMAKCESNTDLHKSILTNSSETTSIALILSQSLEDSANRKTHDLSKIKRTTSERLTAQLNEERGCFYIAPQDGRREKLEEFIFSVTVIYAKNLSLVVPEELVPTLGEGFQFCYSLLGCSVYTDQFFDLNNPDFLADRATASIRSSSQILSKYFGQHCILPVHLMNKDNIIASCSIDTQKLMEIDSKSLVKIESVYDLYRPNEDLQNTNNSESRAKVAVCLELAKAFASSSDSIYSDSQKLENSPHTSHSNKLGKHFNEIRPNSDSEASDCDSTVSESDQEIQNIKKVIKKNRKFSQEKYLSTGYKADNSKEDLQNLIMHQYFERHKKVLLHEAAYEVERWKEEQKMVFMKEWASHEETLQKQLAIEWSTKMKLMEGELGHRLSECDHLHEKLNSALGELSIREEKVKSRENKVNKLERDINAEKEKLQALAKAMENKAEQASMNHSQMLANQVESEKFKKEQLKQQVMRLHDDLEKSQNFSKIQTEEIIHLRRNLIQSNDIIGVSREKEELASKVESLLERKQYYKTQWLSAISDLHKLHSAHKKSIDEITADISGTSPREFYVHGRPAEQQQGRTLEENEPSTSNNLGYKLRKLKDERNILLESGIYPPDHYIIRRIDKKIKELVVKSHE